MFLFLVVVVLELVNVVVHVLDNYKPAEEYEKVNNRLAINVSLFSGSDFLL